MRDIEAIKKLVKSFQDQVNIPKIVNVVLEQWYSLP